MTSEERDRAVQAIAAACHQVNRAWCIAHDDHSQPHWTDAPAWQRRSAIEGVEAALRNPRPEASHENWLRHKEADGWTYGSIKDPAAKTHPCMVPFAELPAEQQMKDKLFVSTVQQLAFVLQVEPAQ